MQISINSQLGLRLNNLETQVELLELLKTDAQKMVDWIKEVIDKGERNGNILKVKAETEAEGNLIEKTFSNHGLLVKIKDAIGEINCISGIDSSYYFICESVYTAAELIKINTNFTGRTLKDIKDGKYTYLMDKNRCIRFVCNGGAIMGFYFEDNTDIGFEFGLEQSTGEYYFSPWRQKEFTLIMQMLTFIELGDIEIKVLEPGRNNGLAKNKGKIANASNNTVYVVDSSWNQLIIRTDGFAVRGHFRLQPCGPNLADRRLIWINAFEKYGYTRRPKGEIVK